jgi:hemoglobin
MTCVTFRVLAATILLAVGSTAIAQSTLFQRLGGTEGVAAIANTLIDRVVADPQLGRSFKDSDVARIKRLLAEQLCELTGGGCQYSGDSMKQTHAGHHIGQAEFYGMVEDLRKVLKERSVDTRSINELLRLLAPMKRDIVEPAAPAAK